MTPCCLEVTKDGNNRFLRNGSKYWADDVALCLKRLEFSTEILLVVSLEIMLYYIILFYADYQVHIFNVWGCKRKFFFSIHPLIG